MIGCDEWLGHFTGGFLACEELEWICQDVSFTNGIALILFMAKIMIFPLF